MTQAEKRAAATPILKAAVLAGKPMSEACELAEVSLNTGARYRKLAEAAEGLTWAEQIDGAIAQGDAPTLQDLTDLIGRRLGWLMKQQCAVEATALVAYCDGLSKLGAVHVGLLKRFDEAKDRANDPDKLIRSLEGFKEWLRRELKAGRLSAETVNGVVALFEPYTADLINGRFEVQPT